MNKENPLFHYISQNTLNPIKSIFDLENNFFFEENDESTSFLDIFLTYQHTKINLNDEAHLKQKFF